MIAEAPGNFENYRPKGPLPRPHPGVVVTPFYLDMNFFTSCSITFFAYTC